MFDLVTIQNGSPVTTTLAIAEGAQVEHKAVIQLVRKYLADLEVFGLVELKILARLKGQHGGGDTEYAILNERQSTLVISWMRNSEIVRAFKLRLVSKFYEMAEELKGKQQPLLPEELLVQQAQMLLEQKKEMLRLEAKQKALEAEVKQTNERLDQIETGIDHFTIIGYARTFLKKSLPLKEAANLGRQATNLCTAMGIAMGTVPDPRFGNVHTYPKSVLDEVCH
jgi:phage regulator Rha-like protein